MCRDYARAMGADANRELVLRFLDEGVRQGKMEIFDEICSTDLVNHAGRWSAVTACRRLRT